MLKAAREDEMFPDEVDTPMNVSARVRFAKYVHIFISSVCFLKSCEATCRVI